VEAAEQKDALATELSVARTEHERALANMDQNSQAWFLEPVTPMSPGGMGGAMAFENPLTMGVEGASAFNNPLNDLYSEGSDGSPQIITPHHGRSKVVSPRSRSSSILPGSVSSPRSRPENGMVAGGRLLAPQAQELLMSREEAIALVGKLRTELEATVLESEAAWDKHQEIMEDTVDMCTMQSEAWQGERMAHILELNKNKERIRTLEAKLMDYARTFTTTPRGQTPRKMTMDPSVIVHSRSSTILDSVAET